MGQGVCVSVPQKERSETPVTVRRPRLTGSSTQGHTSASTEAEPSANTTRRPAAPVETPAVSATATNVLLQRQAGTARSPPLSDPLVETLRAQLSQTAPATSSLATLPSPVTDVAVARPPSAQSSPGGSAQSYNARFGSHQWQRVNVRADDTDFSLHSESSKVGCSQQPSMLPATACYGYEVETRNAAVSQQYCSDVSFPSSALSDGRQAAPNSSLVVQRNPASVVETSSNSGLYAGALEHSAAPMFISIPLEVSSSRCPQNED